MSVIPLLVQSGKSNHGRQLDPVQVKEILETMASQQNTIASLDGRLQALTVMANVMLQRLGGKVKLAAHEMEDADTNGGFSVSWDEETNEITIELTPLEVLEVSVDDEPADVSEPGLAPVPEGSDGPEVAADAS